MKQDQHFRSTCFSSKLKSSGLILGTDEPTQCPEGTFRSNRRGQMEWDCSNCTGGWFCNTTGLEAPSDWCDPGYYCPSRSSSPTERECPEGHYCRKGTEYPSECPEGTFSNSTGLKNSSECTKCLPGFYCEDRKLVRPSGPCTAGYYCPEGSISDKAKKCPGGMHCPTGSAEPKYCSNGNYSDSPMREDCLICPAGFYCISDTVIPGNFSHSFIYSLMH